MHDMFLHNAMFDSSASHNLMPKIIMDILGIDITNPYKDLYSFDSREVKCLGLINYLVFVLHQMPEKSLVMDVVEANVPPKFGMMWSRLWVAKLKGTFQMEISYATIRIFGKTRSLYRENRLGYMINNKENLENLPIYFIDTDMGSSMLFNDLCPQKSDLEPSKSISDEANQQSTKAKKEHGNNDLSPTLKEVEERWLHMDFDGAVRKEGARAGIWIRPPKCEPKFFSYKLYFDCTNNVAEYEALVLGLRVLKNLRAKKIYIYGDSELVINQFKGSYQAKHPRIRSYRNLVLDFSESFKEYHLSVIPRKENGIVDALAVSTSLFKFPVYPNKKYNIEVKHIPTIPNNVDHWQVFDDDKQINRFMEMTREFGNVKIDQENMFEKEESIELVLEYLTQLAGKDIIQLKRNTISRGLVPLEEIFDSNDVAINLKVAPDDAEVEECNIGTEKDPKIIKISKNLTIQNRGRYIKIMK